MRVNDFGAHIRGKVAAIDYGHESLQYRGQQLGPEHHARKVQALRDLEAALAHGGTARATTSGGECARASLQMMIDVGMYDGWPYWSGYPSVCLTGPLGPEWQPFHMLTHYSVSGSGS
jgi:hypothetical protein